MPSSHVKTRGPEANERKRRQERFRKRSVSLFNKANLLAKDTDAWVALIVRDKAGQIRSFRASNDAHWPPSINDIINGQPSGSHKFVKKCFVSGECRVVEEDESLSAEGDDNGDWLDMLSAPSDSEAELDEIRSDELNNMILDTVEGPSNTALDGSAEPQTKGVTLLMDADCVRAEQGMVTEPTHDTIVVDHQASVSPHLDKPQISEHLEQVPSFPQTAQRNPTPPSMDSRPTPFAHLSISSILNPPFLGNESAL